MDGVIRTRVGYAGGSTEDPSYYGLGDHTETIQIDYDPEVVSYEELLDIFWVSHNPAAKPYSQQYKSVIFLHNQEQENIATRAKERIEAETGDTIYTEIVPAGHFTVAETYHQKYLLQSRLDVMRVLGEMFPTNEEFIDSTLTARLNGYFGGHLSLEELREDLEGLDLSAVDLESLMQVISGSN